MAFPPAFLLVPVIGRGDALILPEDPGELCGTVVAHMMRNLFYGLRGPGKELLGDRYPFLMEAGKIGLTDGFLEKGTDIVWMEPHRFRQIVQGDIFLIMIFDESQKLSGEQIAAFFGEGLF